ncbi:uncharacterized protein LOC115630682 isoform X2 [Scaptodrosophila lebanonensis]|uniref:Uncharacterized protein LOC115630682 isoform X2 n=1 Tax=Drosophila lebanonensis TaxID=7225 RepID=A0A6J2U489_DROLE|nr:uncharacterized protein LOC115630682 isoform X2 [Scaptodrosophila lebanonensis]
MAMHSSYLRPNQSQTNNSVSVNSDQMRSFVKDKQAWEHAVALYQGPDPLDHWYNYICWYENHAHSDPENKFRETLERCLTVYEHNDYYRQDPRLVRLWLKYIAMQTDPLHFYQVLYQRGTGRQVAAFYIGWASYYESREEYKDAEAVFNLAFQEKAQSNAELQHAHSKFTYARSLHLQQQQQHLQQAPQPDALQQLATYTQNHHQQQQQHQAHQPMPQSYPQPHRPQQQQQQHHPPYLQHAQQQQSQHIYHQSQYQTHPHELPAEQQPANLPHQHPYPPHQNQQTQAHSHYQHQQPHPLQRYEQQLQATAGAAALQHPHAQAQVQSQAQTQQHFPHIVPHSQLTPPASHYEPQQQTAPPQQQQQQQQQLHGQHPNAHAQPQPQQLNQHQPYQQQNGNGLSTSQAASAPATVESSLDVAGLRLPRNFHPCGRNNHETWKPALTLEEPEDPCRVCHYPKQLVYPIGAGIEYSPEELRARKYAQLLEQRRRQQSAPQQPHQQQANVIVQEQLNQKEPLAYSATVLEQQRQQQLYDSYESEASYYITAVDGALNSHNSSSGVAGGGSDVTTSYNGAESNGAEDEEEAEADEENDDEDSGDDDDEEEEDGDEDEEAETDEVDDAASYTNGNVGATYGMQFSAQTTIEQQNRSIKIKFKKERPAGNDTLQSSTYSAYTIERTYQQQEEHLPASPKLESNVQRQRNGHHFHPYMLGQTSTPKSECVSAANGYRRARGKLKRSKFQADLCSNSNSSSSALEFPFNGEANASAAAAIAQGSAAKARAPASVPAGGAATLQNATFNDNANFSFASASAFDNSNSSLASAVDRLNFRDVSRVATNNNKTMQSHNNNIPTTNNNNTSTIHNATAGNTTVADFSTFQENSYFATQHDIEAKERRLSKALETIERHMAKEAIDPFNSELCRAFLAKLDFPGDDVHASYKIIQTPLPKISNTRTLNVLEGVQFSIDKEVGRGSYGSVYKATDARSGNVVALKYQKPPNTWEIYICDQVLKRITNPEVLPGFMDISTAIIAPNASLIATEFSPFGSLLDINNKIRQATTKVMHESLVMHFSAQICNIVEHLHRQHIIHADIKPDNFLLMRVPSVDSNLPSLRLIDFGCAIDMSLFPDGEHTKFRKVVQTDGFTCIEMQEGRPWSYETDLFCIAGTVHVMLFGEYMQPQKRGSSWDIRQKLPRYLKKHVWGKFFGELLNMQADKLPDLKEMRQIMEEECCRMDSELQKQIRTLSNILHRR